MQIQQISVTVNSQQLLGFLGGLCLAVLVLPAAAQTTYTYDAAGNTITVTSSGGGGGAPAILIQPQTQLLASNGVVSFSVGASGADLSYQWLSNGVPVVNATNDTLFLPNAASTNGSFSVTICNSSGCVTSTPAVIWSDVNGNGIPDWWEMEYFGNLNQTAQGDYDGDGVDNLDEYLEGTDPTNPNSYDPRLYINAIGGAVTASPALPYYTMGQIVTLTAVPDPGETFLGWTGAAVGSKPAISLAMTSHKTVTANFGLPLDVALENTNLICTTGGNTPWFGQTIISEDGFEAAQSGFLEAGQTGGQQSWLQAVTPFSPQYTKLSFWWNVSSQSPDGLTFSIDGYGLASISGTGAGWQLFQTTLSPGSHVLVWVYSKGPINTPTGLPYVDSGWVGGITITNSP